MVLKLTPIRIRGKKSGIPEEKWTYGRKRPRPRSISPPLSGTSTPGSVKSRGSSQASTVRSRQRKRRRLELCLLEQLPSEILQEIFELSENVNLPLSSPALARQLSNKHLYMQLTSRILGHVIGAETPEKNPSPDSDRVHAAVRLLDSRFMTWSFFTEWLRVTAGIVLDLDDERFKLGHDAGEFPIHYEGLWTLLKPSENMLPPTKLLRGPWSRESIAFLKCITGYTRGDITALSPYHANLAQEGLAQAVADQNVAALNLLFGFGAKSSQELLRQAVIDAGCVEAIVEMVVRLVDHFDMHNNVVYRWTRPFTIDPLDPVLWSWIDRATKEGNPKGDWFKKVLRGVENELTSPPIEERMPWLPWNRSSLRPSQ